MSFKHKKVIVMCCKGVFQDHLIQRLAQEFSVCAVVRHEYPIKISLATKWINKLVHPVQTIQHIYAKIKLTNHEKRANQFIQETFKSQIKQKTIPELATNNVNEQNVIDFINQHSPDIICVNGTNLLRKYLLENITPPFGVINLHTGLSPYSRGGNCNLFMLLEEHPELVGITVHHIDKGIDSGDIIISTQADYNENDNYEIIDAKCFKLGIEAMVQACMQLFTGNADKVVQWEKGKLFLNRTDYQYRPYHRLQVNQLIDQGLVRNYLLNKTKIDQQVKTIGNFVVKNV